MNAGVNFKWQDSSSVNMFPVTQRGWYAVVAENVCNRSVDSIRVNFAPCDCVLYFPTGFSLTETDTMITSGPATGAKSALTGSVSTTGWATCSFSLQTPP